MLAEHAEVHVQVGVVVVRGDAELVGGVLADPFDVLGQVGGDLGQIQRVDDLAGDPDANPDGEGEGGETGA